MSENAQQQDPDRVGGGSDRHDGEAQAARREREAAVTRRGGETQPDVMLDIPQVSVDSVRLAVNGLDADVSLRTRVANLLQLDAGVRVHLEGAELDLAGVHAEALLKVRLEKVVEILDRALSTIDRNPQVIQALSRTATAALDDVNRATQQVTGVSGRPAGAGVGGPVRVVGGPTEQPVGAVEGNGGATDELGQRVGPIGRVADQSPHEPAGPGPTRGPGVERGAQRAAERGTEPGVERGTERAAGGKEPGAGRGEPSEASAEGGPDRQDDTSGGAPSPAQLAEQAGETLRRAGRSVWEAIQGGVAQYREERR